MRYRPFGANGTRVSAITLRLSEPSPLRAKEVEALIGAALATGVNSFLIDAASPDLLQGAAKAFATVDRRNLFLGWRLREQTSALSREIIERMMTLVVESLGVDDLDLVLINDPQGAQLPPDAALALKALKGRRAIRDLGVASRSSIDPDLLAPGLFTALASPFNLSSGWAERDRIRAVAAQGLAVMGEDVWPQSLREAAATPQTPRPSLWRRRSDPLADVGGYDFLNHTPGWSAQEICLAYALTEPVLATVQITAESPAQIQRLAQVVERELPDGVSAQIELARFSAQERERAATRL